MSAFAPHPVPLPPSRPGLPDDVFAPDPRDWLRMVGAVLLAAGVAILFVRQEPEWGHFPLFLIVFVPACVLYSLGFIGGLHDVDGERRPLGWQSVY
ncbi:hypothetical protein, partial [Bradyrhizobium sp. NBAIM08]|uniref:hypothetical protein n=1 Tax=Bradyrhizobium sp. NBAIM08 TaxID=2793815 RepID=UPI001CD650E2